MILANRDFLLTALAWTGGGVFLAVLWVWVALKLARFCGTNDAPVLRRGPGNRVQGNPLLIEQESTPV